MRKWCIGEFTRDFSQFVLERRSRCVTRRWWVGTIDDKGYDYVVKGLCCQRRRRERIEIFVFETRFYKGNGKKDTRERVVLVAQALRKAKGDGMHWIKGIVHF